MGMNRVLSVCNDFQEVLIAWYDCVCVGVTATRRVRAPTILFVSVEPAGAANFNDSICQCRRFIFSLTLCFCLLDIFSSRHFFSNGLGFELVAPKTPVQAAANEVSYHGVMTARDSCSNDASELSWFKHSCRTKAIPYSSPATTRKSKLLPMTRQHSLQEWINESFCFYTRSILIIEKQESTSGLDDVVPIDVRKFK